MIKINKLIRREDLFSYLGDSNVSRVELNRCRNRSLKDDSVCWVSIFISLPKSYHLNALAGSLTDAIKNCTEWRKGNKCFVGGIRSIKQTGFINYSDLIRLKQIESEEGVNFGIPNEMLEIIARYR